MELILGISEETNFSKSSLLMHRQTLTPDFKKLRGLLGGSTEVPEI